MPRPVVHTVEEIQSELITLTRIIFLRETGASWTHRDTDPIVLVLNAIAQKIHDGQQDNLQSYLDMLPGESSGEADVWSAMFNVHRTPGERTALLWARQQVAVNNYSSATEPALRDLALSIPNVQDVLFDRREDRDFDVYLVSKETPATGVLAGTPSADLNRQATATLNNIDIIHIDDEMHLQDPTVTGYLVEATLYYNTLNLPALQRQVAEILRKYVVDNRSFTSVPDASQLAQALKVEGVNYVANYGFKLLPADTERLERLPAIENGFYSCDEEVLNNPAALQANKIHVTWVDYS